MGQKIGGCVSKDVQEKSEGLYQIMSDAFSNSEFEALWKSVIEGSDTLVIILVKRRKRRILEIFMIVLSIQSV